MADDTFPLTLEGFTVEQARVVGRYDGLIRGYLAQADRFLADQITLTEFVQVDKVLSSLAIQTLDSLHQQIVQRQRVARQGGTPLITS